MKAIIEGITIQGTPKEMAEFFLEHETQTTGDVLPPMLIKAPSSRYINANTFDSVRKYLRETLKKEYGFELTIDPIRSPRPEPNPTPIMGHSSRRPKKGCNCGRCL